MDGRGAALLWAVVCGYVSPKGGHLAPVFAVCWVEVTSPESWELLRLFKRSLASLLVVSVSRAVNSLDSVA